MEAHRPRAAAACTLMGCVAVVGVLVGACGGREASREALVYDIWSGATAANEGNADPCSPVAPDESAGPLPADLPTVVAGETGQRGTDSPVLEVSVGALDFGATQTLLIFQVHNAGGGSLEYTVAGDQSWMSVSPTSGTNAGTYDDISVQADRTGLVPGTYLGALTIATTDGQQATVTVSVTVAAPPPPPPPNGGSGPVRAAYFFWGWGVDQAQIDTFVPLLAGHYTSACIVFLGEAPTVQANLEHVLSIAHPPDLIVGLTTSDLLSSLEDVAGWQALGSLAAWCAARTGIPRVGIDVEWQLDDYLYHNVPLDLAKYEQGLQAFAAYVPNVEVYFYPPNYEGFSEAYMKTVLQRTRVIAAAAKYLPNFRAMGASISTYEGYTAHPLGAEYRGLEAFWSGAGGPAEQLFLIDDTWWAPDTLRPILPTIPRDCWLYVEPPLDAAKADRLIRCLEAPG